jgi:hypothetical protein
MLFGLGPLQTALLALPLGGYIMARQFMSRRVAASTGHGPTRARPGWPEAP